ncbi:hypothetical protein E2C01_030667 [Portunus trituberculatus]|uniref:Uncharacterized protein n=1 Tax=Portunus trituberculatus TaxID=210409 RepID=A0A5B7EXZ5_PORTR|nr:hypothetical protein [Portunus trituberculatus]
MPGKGTLPPAALVPEMPVVPSTPAAGCKSAVGKTLVVGHWQRPPAGPGEPAELGCLKEPSGVPSSWPPAVPGAPAVSGVAGHPQAHSGNPVGFLTTLQNKSLLSTSAPCHTLTWKACVKFSSRAFTIRGRCRRNLPAETLSRRTCSPNPRKVKVLAVR